MPMNSTHWIGSCFERHCHQIGTLDNAARHDGQTRGLGETCGEVSGPAWSALQDKPQGINGSAGAMRLKASHAALPSQVLNNRPLLPTLWQQGKSDQTR